ncbi:Transposase, IS30 family [Lacticaseibacillus paracasei]|nr:Transposase, IS30 family [Lacticaseibacillus paracasei]
MTHSQTNTHKHYQQLSFSDRATIQALQAAGDTATVIAQKLHRSKATISREITRGSVTQLDSKRHSHQKLPKPCTTVNAIEPVTTPFLRPAVRSSRLSPGSLLVSRAYTALIASYTSIATRARLALQRQLCIATSTPGCLS